MAKVVCIPLEGPPVGMAAVKPEALFPDGRDKRWSTLLWTEGEEYILFVRKDCPS